MGAAMTQRQHPFDINDEAPLGAGVTKAFVTVITPFEPAISWSTDRETNSSKKDLLLLQFMREQRAFRYFWLADFISQLGTQISYLGIPLVAVAELHASSFEVSVLIALGWLPVAILSLPAGAYVDRVDRRSLLIICNLARCAVLLLIPVAYYSHFLSIWLLYLVTFLIGSFTIVFDIAQRSYVPEILARDRLIRGNSLLEIGGAITRVGGPGLAGAIISIFSAPVAILLDSISYIISSFFLHKIVRPNDAQEDKVEQGAVAGHPSFVAQVKDGIYYVFRHRLLRPLFYSSALANFGSSVMEGILIVYAVRELGLSAGELGIVFGIANVGLLVGAASAISITERLGLGRTLITSSMCQCLGLLLLPMASVAPLIFLSAGLAFRTIGIVTYNVNQRSLRQAVVPANLQGRVSATGRFISWGAIPVGTLLGGSLASVAGFAWPLWLSAFISAIALMVLILSSVRRLRVFPSAETHSYAGQNIRI